jgi:hypothetical protein
MKVESILDMEDEELVEATTKHLDQWQRLLDRLSTAQSLVAKHCIRSVGAGYGRPCDASPKVRVSR